MKEKMKDGEFEYVPEDLQQDFKLTEGLIKRTKTRSGYCPRRQQQLQMKSFFTQFKRSFPPALLMYLSPEVVQMKQELPEASTRLLFPVHGLLYLFKVKSVG